MAHLPLKGPNDAGVAPGRTRSRPPPTIAGVERPTRVLGSGPEE